MRKTIYIICAALTILSCSKDKEDIIANGLLEESIEFAPCEATSTKAMMNDAALKTVGNKIRVFDILEGFTGRATWMTYDGYYIDNEEIRYNGNPVWEYVSGKSYPWTSDGSHLFFGWLSYDSVLQMTDADFFGNSYNYNSSTRVLSIPTLEMNTDTPQFDFMYSKVSLVDAADRVAENVNLELKHLFSALNITLKNTSGNKIYLKSVILKSMKNVRSASVAFTQENPTVTTANLASTDVVLFQSDANDGKGTEFNHEDREKGLTDFYLMWPQDYTELSGAKLEVKYYVYSNDQFSDELSADIVLSNQNIFKTNQVGMDAGTKYSFMLQFKKSTIDLYISVLPWEYEAYDWDYSDHSISARSGMFKDGVLAFYRYDSFHETYTIEPTPDEWSAKSMKFKTRNEVMKGRFYIEAPTSGFWQINAFPLSAAQYFIIEPTSGEIDVNTDNGKAEFTISVNPALSPSTTQNLYFNVAIYFNGEWHDANSEFNRKNFKLVLDAN